MSSEYKIESVGSQFIVVDPWGEIVDDTLRKRKRGKTPNGANMRLQGNLRWQSVSDWAE